MKKIILLNNTTSSILGFRKHLIQFLIEKGYKVYAMAVDFNEKTEKEVRELGAIPVNYNLSRGGLNPVEDYKSILGLQKIFKEIQPDIVLSSFVKPVIYGTIAAKRAKVPTVLAMLEGLGYSFTEQPEGQSLKAKFIKQVQLFLYRIALPKADAVLFLNHDDPKDLLEKNHIKVKKQIVLGAIGLNLEDYPYVEAPIQPISFIFIGRLLREKGIFEYLRAAEIIKQKYPQVIFNVIGGLDTENPGGLKKDELDYYINNKIIHYPGFVNNVDKWIKNSSVFVLPSYYREGIPRSTQEAMAIGRPVITTDVPGCRETVENGKNGFLIPKWNTEVLVQKMEDFIHNPRKIKEMGEESHKMALEKYDGKKVNEKLLDIIKSLEK